tara:strand:- start:1112 stop:1222 length:111 start_codon:yes stop_codon:yes gene_type:complete
LTARKLIAYALKKNEQADWTNSSGIDNHSQLVSEKV